MSYPPLETGHRVKGADRKTQDVLIDIGYYAKTREPILILGETGTGKEVFAQEIHEQSPRRDKPFIPVNCSELSPELASSELFGHERGAYTGAIKDRPGLAKTADTGTLFLDEFGELPLIVQARLLRFIQDNTVRAQGADKTETLNVRIIAATNRDVEQEALQGRFRYDLINRFQKIIRVAPLRERPADIEPLVHEFIKRHAGKEGMNPHAKTIRGEALELLKSYSWPDNARGLEHAVKDALIKTYADPVECLGPEHFQLSDVPRLNHSSAAKVASEGVKQLAEHLLTELIDEKIEPVQIRPLAKSFQETSLEFQLAQAFLRRFSGQEAERMANKLFTYTSAEAVRRYIRGFSE
jgi:DNA-binding NtrC family response regulator